MSEIEYIKYLIPILYIGIVQSLFAAVMVLFKKPRTLSDKILAAWLFFIFIKLLLSYLEINYSRLFLNKMGMLIVPMLFGPLLYLYVRSLIPENPVFRKKDWLHFLPFLIFSVYALIFSTQKPVYNIQFFEKDGFLAERIVFGLSFYFLITVYTLLAIKLLHTHRIQIKDMFSYSSEKVTLRWVMFVAILFSVVYILVISSGIFNIFIVNRELIEPELFSSIGLTLLSFAVSFYGYRQANINIKLSGTRSVLMVNGSVSINDKPKYERSSLKEKDIEKYLEKILSFMEEEKPFLNNELTIQDLSDQVSISKHHITQVINTKLIKNFYAFVNEYRIEEVKKRLLDPRFKNLKIMSIAYDSGFSSKSSFNTIFKNYTGMTPSQFVKKHSKKRNEM